MNNIQEIRLAITVNIHQLHLAVERGWDIHATRSIEAALKFHRAEERRLLKAIALEDKPTFFKANLERGRYATTEA